MSKRFATPLVLLLILTSSCTNPVTKAVSDAKYSAYEMVGLEKRDLFKREVSNVKEEQEETGEAFDDALTKLKEVYAFDGGDLEKEYGQLKSSYDDAKEKSGEVSKRIGKMDTVAKDLFTEWEHEIKQISTKDLRERSSKELRETRKKYQGLHKQMKESEARIKPVLSKLNDQVLFLKHNLNAKAISGLKAESVDIQKDIELLIKDMEISNKQAQELIETL